MKNKYLIDEKYIRKFSDNQDGYYSAWCNLFQGKSVIVATGHRDSVYNPYTEWKLKPNGDGTFSAYRLS